MGDYSILEMHASSIVGCSRNSNTCLDNIEGGSGGRNSMQEMSLISGGSGTKDAIHDRSRDVSILPFIVGSDRKQNFPTVQPFLSPPVHRQQVPHNHFRLPASPSPVHRQQVPHNHSSLLSASPRPLRAVPAGTVPEGVVLPLANIEDVLGSSDQTDMVYGNPGLSTNSLLKQVYNYTIHSLDMNISKVNLAMHTRNSNKIEAGINSSPVLCADQNDMRRGENINVPKKTYLRPHAEREPEKKLEYEENQMLAQNHTSKKQQKNENNCTVSDTTVTVAMPGVPSSRSHGMVSRRQTTKKGICDRLRRERISEGVKALQELVPDSIKGGKESVLDNVIDYTKFLKFQLKALSQSRLGGEAMPDTFIHLEGYGHYLIQDKTMSGPLEDMIGELMETDMPAAFSFLESKGLYVMPMGLANDLFEAL